MVGRLQTTSKTLCSKILLKYIQYIFVTVLENYISDDEELHIKVDEVNKALCNRQ